MSEQDEATTEPQLSLREFANTLTGFDEIAIEKSFRHEVTELSDTRVARALAFVMLRRDGLDDKAAYGEVMRLPFSAIKERFRVVADEDEGAEGND